MPLRRHRSMPSRWPPHDGADARAPNALLMLLEGRAPMEFFSLVAALPWLARLPRGDGHPVLVFPGMGASDITTVPLRRCLQALGYVTQAGGRASTSGRGRASSNAGPTTCARWPNRTASRSA